MSSPVIPIHMKIALGIISSITILLQTDLEAELWCHVYGLVFGVQAQQVGDSGPRSPRQWICRERVIELGPNEVSVS